MKKFLKSQDESRQEKTHKQKRQAARSLKRARVRLLNVLTASDWFEIGITLMQSGDVSGAIRAFDRSIEVDPLAVDVYLKRGEARAMTGDFQAALDDYKMASELSRTKKKFLN